MVKVTARPLYPWERPGALCVRSSMGRRASWAGAEYLDAAGIRSSNPPARSETLNRLSYPCPIVPSSATLWTHSLLPVIPETTLKKSVALKREAAKSSEASEQIIINTA